MIVLVERWARRRYNCCSCEQNARFLFGYASVSIVSLVFTHSRANVWHTQTRLGLWASNCAWKYTIRTYSIFLLRCVRFFCRLAAFCVFVCVFFLSWVPSPSLEWQTRLLALDFRLVGGAISVGTECRWWALERNKQLGCKLSRFQAYVLLLLLPWRRQRLRLLLLGFAIAFSGSRTELVSLMRMLLALYVFFQLYARLSWG